MHAIIPQLSAVKRTPGSLRKLCLRSLASSSKFSGSDVQRLPLELAQALLEECQARFALDQTTLERFFCVPLRSWTAREVFLEESLLFESALSSWSSSLTALELWTLSLSSEVLSSVGERLPNLVRLSLCHLPNLDDVAGAALFSDSFCSRLQELSLSGLQRLTSIGLAGLGRSGRNLRVLRIDGCGSVADAVAQACRQAGGGLRELQFAADDAVAKVLAEACPNLETLLLENGDVTDRGMRPLLRVVAPRLLRLSLAHTAVSCATLEALRGREEEDELPLRELDLSRLCNITKDAVEELLYRCANLTVLLLKVGAVVSCFCFV